MEEQYVLNLVLLYLCILSDRTVVDSFAAPKVLPSSQSLSRVLPVRQWSCFCSSDGILSGGASDDVDCQGEEDAAVSTTAPLNHMGPALPSAIDTEAAFPTAPLPSTLGELDMIYKKRRPLTYDPKKDRFVCSAKGIAENGNATIASGYQESSNALTRFFHNRLVPQFEHAFFPAGVTSNYYRFVKWRTLQRFINSNLHVLGTQSLLLGLGVTASTSSSTKAAVQLGALAAALRWILKDALGKVVRLVWASQMGGRFDSDAKRWRFRSTLVYAAGNALELLAGRRSGNGSSFLLFATLANALKQMAFLTNSSTRTSVYNSFRDGSRENIGDITAKGEAQVAIVDLLGIASGVALTKGVLLGGRRALILSYLLLQSMEITCVYQLLKSVQYRVLNYERLVILIRSFAPGNTGTDDHPSLETATSISIPDPVQMSELEGIVQQADYLTRRRLAYGSISRARLSPTELEHLLYLCRKERFLLVVGENEKRKRRFWFKAKVHNPCENCHIVLHAEANNLDIVKSTLALHYLRQLLVVKEAEMSSMVGHSEITSLRSSDCLPQIKEAIERATKDLPVLLELMKQRNWESPARFMFGRVHKRAEWPLSVDR